MLIFIDEQLRSRSTRSWARPPPEGLNIIPHEKMCVLSFSSKQKLLRSSSRGRLWNVVFAWNMLWDILALKIYSQQIWKSYWALEQLLSFVRRMSFVKNMSLICQQNLMVSAVAASCFLSSGNQVIVSGSTLASSTAAPPGQDSQFPARVAITCQLRWAKRLLKYMSLLGSLNLSWK